MQTPNLIRMLRLAPQYKNPVIDRVMANAPTNQNYFKVGIRSKVDSPFLRRKPMKKANSLFSYLFYILLIASISGCGGDSASPTTDNSVSHTYSTTSTRGDFAEWTLNSDMLNTTWQIVNDTGLIDQTLTINAICANANTHGVRACIIDTVSCADGVSTCTNVPVVGDSFDLMDVPGVALFTITEAGTPAQQLHVGFIKDNGACTDDLTGDYSFVHIGLSGNENFGLYRSDSNFLNIRHVDFGFDTSDANIANQTVAYRTGSESTLLTDNGCTDGVRQRASGLENFRLMMTASGLFVLDFPSGKGGIVSFKTTNAATLADFAGKSFGGVSFPDIGLPSPVSGVFGSIVGSKIDIALTGGGTAGLMDLGTVDTVTAPPYPDFTVTPPDYAAATSVLRTSYPTPDDIPGLFKMDGSSDSGRVVLSAMKFGSKVIAIGVVYNYRDTFQIDHRISGGVTNFSQAGLYNTGEFILFER